MLIIYIINVIVSYKISLDILEIANEYWWVH